MTNYKLEPRVLLLLLVPLLMGLCALPAEALTEPAAALQEEGGGAPDWFSVVPPIVAILAALILRSVIPALFLGVWLGAWGAAGLGFEGLFVGLGDMFDTFVLQALANEDHASIILFSLMIGGMVGIVMRNGGMQGIVDRITAWTNTSRRAQLATSWLGLGIFFDDYANSLVVGNTMRPVTDRLRISREKLAYLVDSTAAPVACVMFVTTWIGMEVGLIGDGLRVVGASDASAYDVFLSSLRFSFYPILCMGFVLMIAYTGRDFGPMLVAERRARSTGETLRPGSNVDEGVGKQGVQPVEGKPHRPINAVLPIAGMLLTVLWGMWQTGNAAIDSDNVELEASNAALVLQQNELRAAGASRELLAAELVLLEAEPEPLLVGDLRTIIGKANSYVALMWGSLLGVLLAAALSLGQGILSLEQAIDAWYQGLRAMLFAMIVLVLAWSLGGTTDALGTGAYLGELVGDSLSVELLPAIVFLLAAAIAFATGTSWGTMSILMPLVFPLTWNLLAAQGVAAPIEHGVLLSVISSVLAGAVWGDHCSPISDTTILSSMVSGCDHLDHVRTQLPYALLVGSVALVVCSLPCAYGLPWWLAMLAGIGVLYVALRVLGTSAEEPA